MQFNKFIHYAKRALELGPRASVSVIKNRFQKKRSYAACKRKALARRAHYEWEQIVARHNVQQSFSAFLWRLRFTSDQTFPVSLLQPFADDAQNQEKADRFVAREFDLLGSSPIQFAQIPWHEDFRLREQCVPRPVLRSPAGEVVSSFVAKGGRLRATDSNADCTFNPHQFYQDIVVQTGTGAEFIKDIKVPWELSRCYHFAVLGQAYQATCDKKYVDAFVEQARSWMQENPFMLGVNWVCPMEVGIRAINWVCAFYLFKDAPRITDEFWEQFVCTLYDHFVYLENNWEIYDSRTSNHYLSDLVGYFSLCCFFIDLPGVREKQLWCHQEIMREWDKQVFVEGSDYEGSTAYHGLVTELFFVFTQFCKKTNLPLSQNLSAQLSSMIEFMAWCTPQSADQIITVGDNDSGRVLYHGLPQSLVQTASKIQSGTRHFSDFGLSIIKIKKHHITLRHHAYSKRQPSGHFHNDAGSMTLAIDGIPVIVDPGSFVYTPSAAWRNHFRSVEVHNTCFLAGIEPVNLKEYLFGLPLPEHKLVDVGCCECVEMVHCLYEQQGVMLNRRINFDDASGCVTIADTWLPVAGGSAASELTAAWNFTLAPGIEASMCDGGWQLSYGGRVLAVLSCDELEFMPQEAWNSPQYGVKIRTTALRVCVPLAPGKQHSIVIAQ